MVLFFFFFSLFLAFVLMILMILGEKQPFPQQEEKKGGGEGVLKAFSHQCNNNKISYEVQRNTHSRCVCVCVELLSLAYD